MHLRLNAAELVAALDTKAPSYATVTRWYREFQAGKINFSVDPRSGRPSTAVIDENIAAVQELIEQDPRITTEMIAVNIGSSRQQSILFFMTTT